MAAFIYIPPSPSGRRFASSMNLIFISKENKILHVAKDTLQIDYTFYDKNGRIIDGGQYEEIDTNKTIEETAKELIEEFDILQFSEPYIKLNGIQADNFIEIIEEQDYKNMKNKVSNYLKDVNDYEIEKC